ncbi:MAG: hypothetical protein RL632_2376 [Bacteroidota bacterium]|jgi:hypothetical protein
MKSFLIIFSALTLGLITLNSCNKDKVPVDCTSAGCSDTISFANQILPLIQNNCTGCHDVGNSTGYTLTEYSNIAANADAILNSLYGTSVALMPQGGPALADSLIQQFSCWKCQGKLDN